MPEFDYTDYRPKYATLPGSPAYRIGTDGSVWSSFVIGGTKSAYGEPWRLMKTRRRKGRPVVGLKRNGKNRPYYVHSLVLEAFVGPRPPGMFCRHFPDRDVANNRLSNLQWGTAKENGNDKIIHGTAAKGERVGTAKLTTEKVLYIRSQRTNGRKLQDIADELGVDQSLISSIALRKVWRHI